MTRRLSFQLTLLWSLFAFAALAAVLAVYRLHHTAQEEISSQRDRALVQEKARILARAQAITDQARRDTAAKLASFHVDGLARTLRQWEEATPAVLGSFLLGSAVENAAPPAGSPSLADLQWAWNEFRVWREAHPTDFTCDLTQAAGLAFVAERTLDNPAYPAAILGYQQENLDILTHDDRRADPWAAWLARPDAPEAPWIFLYQTSPDEPVRGCFLETTALLAQLRADLSDPEIARFTLLPADRASADASLIPGLPAHRLLAEGGTLFLAKENSVRLNALIVSLLVAVFLLVGLLLTAYTRRETLEAGRKITFVTQVSHELRTPLTSIRMFADMLGEPGLAEAKRVKFAQTIGAESSRLHALIERLLAFNALEKNPRTVACVPLDVTAVVAEIAQDIGPALLKSGLQLVNELPAGPVRVLSDHSTLKQALINLLDNAVKYGGGTVRLSLAEAGDVVLLRVADDGPGVPGNIRDRLFEPFVQGGQQLTDKPSGVGLGLSLARGLLRQVRADLVLVDTPRGATFEIRLPCPAKL